VRPAPASATELYAAPGLNFPAKIIGGSQAAGFTWVEQEGTSGGGWQAKSGGRNSTDDGKAYLANDIVEAAAIANLVVWLRRVPLNGGGSEWRFDPPLPTPTTQYMVLAVDDAAGTKRWHEDDVRSP